MGPLFSIFSIYLGAYTFVPWGSTEQTLETHTHPDKEPACLTHTVITSLFKKALYDELPLAKHGLKNTPDSNKTE